MAEFPDTRYSLLVRLEDRDDAAAWEEFVATYRPLVQRLALAKGLQHADAEELAQEALLAVASAVGRWRSNPNRGPFRLWLSRIAKNRAVNMLTRRRQDVGSGDSDVQRLLEAHAAPDDAVTSARIEYRREVFAWAAGQVRCEFRDSTWRAFWLTCVEGQVADTVAAELGLSVGAVYIARSRVSARLRETVRLFDPD